MNLVVKVIDVIFALGLFINAVLFIPQAIRIIRLKHARDVSLATFGGFCFIQLASVAYGFIHKDYIIFIGFLLSLLMCGTVTMLIIKYRNN